MKMAESSPTRYKTLWEKEKLLVTSNFPFSNSVFKWLVLQPRKNQGLFGKGLKKNSTIWITIYRLPENAVGIVEYFCLLLTLSQTSPGFYVSAGQVFWKHCGKRRNCSRRTISPFPTVFSTRLDNFLPFSSNLKLSSANCFSLEESKICRSEKG